LYDLLTADATNYTGNPDFVLRGDLPAVIRHFEKQAWLVVEPLPNPVGIFGVSMPNFAMTPTESFPGQPDVLTLTLPVQQHAAQGATLQQQAADAASLYIELFLLEATLRNWLERQLRAKFGTRWLEEGVPDQVAGAIKRLSHHDDRDWQSGPEEPSLKFATFLDLARIIEFDVGRNVLPLRSPDHRSAVVAMLRRLEPYRDDIAHMRTLPDADRRRFLDMIRDLQNRFDAELASGST